MDIKRLIKQCGSGLAIWTAMCIVGALIIHFKSPSVYSKITADGMLTYIVTCASAAATVILARAALWQTNKANDMAEKANDMAKEANKISQRLLELEESRYKLELRPFVMVTQWAVRETTIEEVVFSKTNVRVEVADCTKGEIPLGLFMKFANTTQSYISAQFLTAKVEGDEAVWRAEYLAQQNFSMRLLAGEQGEICFYVDKKFFFNNKTKKLL